jgi:multicomponent Na+:H+ antiporter subunit A
VFFLCALAPAATVVWAVSQAGTVLDGDPVTSSFSWVSGLGVDVDLRLDAFSLLMVGLVAGVGVLVFVYSRWYFSPQAGLGRFAGTLTAFAGSMLGLVLADNLLLVYVFWELTSVTSYLLIGFEDHKGSARAAALQAILVTGVGGLVMLAGFVLLGEAAGTYSLSDLLADPPRGGTVPVALVLVLVGAITKSAQVPFHFWLPGAMAGPTPVSTYLHSATMVKGGVYLVARLAPAFATVGLWRPLILGLGLASLFLGGYRALRQHDVKYLLAYGTISQLGLMMVLFGVGIPEATLAGAALLVAHGAFKAALFMVVGVIDHQAHTRDLRVLDGLGRRLPWLAAVAAVSAASMAGLPLLFGFVAKEAAYEAFLHDSLALGSLVLAGVVAGSALTVAYSARFVWGAFAAKAPAEGSLETVGPDVARPPSGFVVPATILAGITVVLGVAPGLVGPLVYGAAAALDSAVEASTLAVWHGINPALILSVITVAGGVLLFVARRRVARVQDALPVLPGADDAYRGALIGLNRVADAVTGFFQNGSLPVYLGVILTTAVVLPLPALLGAPFPEELVVAESLGQAAVAVLIVAAAVGAVVSRRRFPAVLYLGAVGYGVAVLFVIQGAPDLALTQLLVETLSVVIFVLVLRHLPDRFQRMPWKLGRAARLAVAGGVGTFVAAFTLVAGAARREPSISSAFLDRALPDAGGRNVVNVILVDFRGFDTLGEITVLTVAAFGIFSLVRACRRERAAEDAQRST